MLFTLHTAVLCVVLFPLIGSAIAGIFGKQVGVAGSQAVTILGVAISLAFSLYIYYYVVMLGVSSVNFNVYTWGSSGNFTFAVGFLVDRLSALMMVVVTFVSLAVHVYSIGYMRDDSGNQRFFSYMSLFTFMMLMLVGANNFLQLFFGWEGVGLVSYLLIGFWFKRESANFGSLKAFLVNRVGDFGFLLGIAAIFNYLGTVDYLAVFSSVSTLTSQTIHILPDLNVSVLTVICILLFIGAMGKSAQMPLHVWLPESMEGPTPISALIHAATMVTAGVYMISRMSPLFEYSQPALSFILVIGASTALFMGFLAIVQTDIKRVIAYSTLSQLGYMIAALGASAFAAGMFQLVTHAFFKALLFLAAGSVIVALHHEQDMRKMGNLYRRMPITYICFLIGALALAAIPPFAGFYSKDAIIEVEQLSRIPGAHYAYYCLLIGSFVTAFYIFRAFFLVFHTNDRTSAEARAHLHESPPVIWLPLVVLAIPSIFAGTMLVNTFLYKANGLLGTSLFVLPQYNVLGQMAGDFHGQIELLEESFTSLPFWLAIFGVVFAWLFYVRYPEIPGKIAQRFSLIYKLLIHKYGFDDFNQIVFANGSRKIAEVFYKVGDVKILDDQFVNGSGRLINYFSRTFRKLQSGYLYHYAFAMIIGLLVFLAWLIF